jgi:poly(3-hydroxybutyrate) depolymerase
MFRHGFLVALVFMAAAAIAPSQAAPADSCQPSSTKMSDGKDMFFRLYVPKNISTQKRYPLVMNLHGIGECGTDNKNQVNQSEIARQWMLDSVKNKYQAFVFYPQCPSSSYEWGYFNTGTAAQKGFAGLPAVAAIKIIDSLIKIYPIDTTRLYVGGLSWGGIGTEAIMMSYPDKFAAAFPCAGENKLNTVSVMTKTPFWISHGNNDKTVPVEPDRQLVTAVEAAKIPIVRFVSSRNMAGPTGISVDSLRKAVSGGSLYLYSEIINGDHGSGWLEAYESPLLVPWLMSKSKVAGKTVFTWPAPGPGSATTALDKGARPAQKIPGSVSLKSGIIRWSGVSLLPSTLNVYAGNGTLLLRRDIDRPDGSLASPGLAEGAYRIEIHRR